MSKAPASVSFPHYLRLKSNIPIRHKSVEDRERTLLNLVEDVEVKALKTGVNIFWAIFLCDKGYQSANELLKTVLSHKRLVASA